MSLDTTRASVEKLIDARAQLSQGHDAACKCGFCTVDATLRALLDERDAAQAERDDAVKLLSEFVGNFEGVGTGSMLTLATFYAARTWLAARLQAQEGRHDPP